MKKISLNSWVFCICTLIVIFTQITLLQPMIHYQLFNLQDDWMMLMRYKELSYLPFLSKLIYIWTQNGLHDSAAVIHIGILNDIFGNNYQAYQYANVFFKILSVLTVFPLVLIIFKNKLLAFLTTILYGISAGSTGSFFWIMKGGYYGAIAFMNLFLICYYYTITKRSKLFLLISLFLFLLSYLLSPPRIYPLLAVTILAEIFWLLKMGWRGNLKFSILRLLCFFLSITFIILKTPVSPCCPITKLPFVLIKNIVDGNWHNLLSPFGGIGYSLLTNDFWKFFGELTQNTFTNFGSYFAFLMGGPIWIFGLLTMVLSFFISKKPRKFIFLVFNINLTLEIIMFFIANHHFYISNNLIMPYDPGLFMTTKYPTLVSFYIFAVASACFLEWFNDKKNTLLLAIWVGPVFSFIFLLGMWAILGYLIDAYSSVQYYHLIPPMGMALFLSSILVLVYSKFKKTKIFEGLGVISIFLIISKLYILNGLEISRNFLGNNPERVTFQDQQLLLDKLTERLDDRIKKGNLLIYFQLPEDLHTKNFYKTALILDDSSFGDMINSRNDHQSGCKMEITDKNTLKSSIRFTNKQLGFVYKGKCLANLQTKSKENTINNDNVFYNKDDFYAFKIDNGEFIDIKQELLKELNF